MVNQLAWKALASVAVAILVVCSVYSLNQEEDHHGTASVDRRLSTCGNEGVFLGFSIPIYICFIGATIYFICSKKIDLDDGRNCCALLKVWLADNAQLLTSGLLVNWSGGCGVEFGFYILACLSFTMGMPSTFGFLCYPAMADEDKKYVSFYGIAYDIVCMITYFVLENTSKIKMPMWLKVCDMLSNVIGLICDGIQLGAAWDKA